MLHYNLQYVHSVASTVWKNRHLNSVVDKTRVSKYVNTLFCKHRKLKNRHFWLHQIAEESSDTMPEWAGPVCEQRYLKIIGS